jgi:hypothetical protein
VEGLELPVFHSFVKTIEKFRPIILCELEDPKERQSLLDLFLPFDYRLYYLENKKLKALASESLVDPVSHNHYFIPVSRLQNLEDLIA